MKPIKKATNIKGQTMDTDLFDKKRQEKHLQDLGLEVPKDYFSKSKSKIEAFTFTKKKSKLIQLRNSFIWMAAAGIALIFALTVYKFNTDPNAGGISTKASDTIEKIQKNYLNNDKLFSDEDAILLSSLYVDENQINDFVDNTFIDEIIIDEYIDAYIIENTMEDEFFFN